jgi:excisionase family DNA binding protein
MDAKTYTTGEAAARIGVSRQTLHTWIEAGRIAAPRPIAIGHRSIRFWTKADIEKARKFKGTLKSGPRAKNKER